MENKVNNGESGRRRFIRRLTTLGAAGGIATLLYGRVTEKPLIQLAQAGSGDPILIDETNTGTGMTTLTAFANGSMTLYVENQSTQDISKAILGDASGYEGKVTGVFGESSSTDGRGVEGYATQSTGATFGVYGGSNSAAFGTGVYGEAIAATGTAYGVYGRSFSSSGISVYGQAGNPGAKPIVARGASNQTADLQEWQASDGTAYTVVDATGHLGAGTANPEASIHGQTGSTSGIGVKGYATSVSGTTYGVHGKSNAIDGVGVYGLLANYSGTNAGVRGETYSIAGGAAVLGYAGSLDGSAKGVHGISVNLTGVGVMGEAGRSGVKPIVARGADGQTANLQEWQNTSGAPLAVVDASGNFGIGTATPARQVHIRGNNAVARLDRNVDSASFIFVRTSTDFNTVLKTFTFGVKATGVDAGSFFIGDMHTNVSGSSDNRLLIDTSGNVGIGTTTPSSKLHVAGRVKALGYDTGDITFANGVRATEEADGLAFLNNRGTKIAVLDSEGNFHIKGDIIKDL